MIAMCMPWNLIDRAYARLTVGTGHNVQKRGLVNTVTVTKSRVRQNFGAEHVFGSSW